MQGRGGRRRRLGQMSGQNDLPRHSRHTIIHTKVPLVLLHYSLPLTTTNTMLLLEATVSTVQMRIHIRAFSQERENSLLTTPNAISIVGKTVRICRRSKTRRRLPVSRFVSRCPWLFRGNCWTTTIDPRFDDFRCRTMSRYVGTTLQW
jgi:hypothetical protein